MTDERRLEAAEPPSRPGSDEPDAAGRVAAEVLHEIRNVLNPIVSAAYLLKLHADDAVRVRDLADRIEAYARSDDRIAERARLALARERAQHSNPSSP